MKTLRLLAIAMLFMAVSCDEAEDPSYSVAPEAKTYVDNFYAEASGRGIDLSQSNLKVVVSSNAQAITSVSMDGDQKVLTINKGSIDAGTNIESMVFHDLARLLLDREIVEPSDAPVNKSMTPYSIMNPNVKFYGYPDADRESLLDELFE
jgi:hypothetical protein